MQGAESKARRPSISVSLFYRIYFVYGVLILLVAAVSIQALNYGHYDKAQVRDRDRWFRLANYVLEEIGNPPNPERAAALSKKLAIPVLLRTTTRTWSSDPAIERDYQATLASVRSVSGSWMIQGDYFLRNEGQSTLVLRMGAPMDLDRVLIASILSLLAAALLVAGGYWVIHWVFLPVQRLEEGAKRFGAGDLGFRVQLDRRDEIGRLSATFNAMADQISEHINSVRALMRALSHELRSPLTRMKVALQLLPEGDHRTAVNEEVELLDGLVTSLLAQERLSADPRSIERTPIDLVSLIRKVCGEFAKAQTPVQSKISEKELLAEADSDLLSLCIRNVIQNALNHGQPARGPIEVSVRESIQKIEVLVQDHGPGIPKDELENVLKPFYQLDRSRTGNRTSGGFGLGLSLCKVILDAHQGSFWLENSNQGGVCAHLELPRSSDS